MDDDEVDSRVSTRFEICGNCHYQLENARAQCRNCLQEYSHYDEGRPDRPWFGLYEYEYRALSRENRIFHIEASRRRLYTGGRYSYLPPTMPPGIFEHRNGSIPSRMDENYDFLPEPSGPRRAPDRVGQYLSRATSRPTTTSREETGHGQSNPTSAPSPEIPPGSGLAPPRPAIRSARTSRE